MYRLVSILSSLLFFLAAPALADIHTAVDCQNSATYPNVQNAINAASDGDVVQIPACSKTIWTQKVTVPNTKSLTIAGAGVDQTIISYNITTSGALKINLGVNKVFKLTNLTMTSETGVDTGANYGVIDLSGEKTGRFRIHHMKFDKPETSRCILVSSVKGVVDNVTFNKLCWRQAVLVSSFGWNNGGFGDGKWSDTYPTLWGTEDAVFIEDCTFTTDTSCGSDTLSVVDCENGGRFVFRYNNVTNSSITNHGADTGGRNRSCLSGEIYGNSFSHSPNRFLWVQWRGGTAIVYNNILNGYDAGFGMYIWRHDPTSDCGSTGDNCWYGGCYDTHAVKYICSNRQIDCTTNGAPDQSKCSVLSPAETCKGPIDDPTGDGKGYPCLDQPGRGPADIGATNLIPIFIWGNTMNGTSRSGYIVEGIDFCNHDTSTACGGVTINYAAYRYPHPLRLDSPKNLRIVGY